MTLMGITINDSKSIISGKSPHVIEFAKRLFYNGVEVSGISSDILKQGMHPYGYIDLIQYALTRA
jgi:hypothetical protein